MGKIEEVKKVVWKNTPEQLKPYIKYLYYASKIPFNYPRSLNTFKYVTSVGKKERISFIPPIFESTISTACNLRCPNCLYVLKDPDVFKGGDFIKVDDFRTVIDKYAKGIDVFWLGGGEPLLHPELDTLAKIVRDKGLKLRVSTNGILIDRWIDILKSFDFINVSMDGYDYESFRRFRGGTKKQFDKILEGLSLLRKNNIEFSISFILTQENLDEAHEMIEFAYKVQPFIVHFHNINPHGSKEYDSLTLSSQTVSHLANIMSKEDYPFDISLPVIFDTESEHFETAKCIQPWYYCCSDNKGAISYCCHLRHDLRIGNIFDDYDFNSDMMSDFRQLMIKHQYPEADCRYCQRRFMGEEYGRFDSKLKKWASLRIKGVIRDN